ncbi:hypothetical protein ACUXJ4_000918 [Bacillus pumilus]
MKKLLLGLTIVTAVAVVSSLFALDAETTEQAIRAIT